jgi:Mrp family chromosome partitioning ATPase
MMEHIGRALAKTRAQAPPNLHPVEEESSRMDHDPVPRVTPPDSAALALNPKTLEANRIVAWNKRDPRTPAFDILRTKVLKAMTSRGWTTLAVTSPTEDCGKTTVAINLAFSMAHQMPSEVVLVDFDLRRPQVGAYLGIEPPGDLSSFLEGHGPLETHVVKAGGVQLGVVSTQGVRQNATELLGKARVEQLMGNLRGERTGRIGIFDLPPLLATDDALAVLPRIDCALVVVGERATRKSDVSEALNLLSGTNLLGVVLNQSRAQLRSYYY